MVSKKNSSGKKIGNHKKRVNEHLRNYYHHQAWVTMDVLCNNLPSLLNRLFKEDSQSEQYSSTVHSVCVSAFSPWKKKVRNTDSPVRASKLLHDRLMKADNLRDAMDAVNELTVVVRRHLRH